MDLEKIFNPKAIAFIGATDRKGSVGYGVSKNLLAGRKRRKIFFVNPFKKKVFQKKTYGSILDISEKVDLAVIAVPAPAVLGIIKECAKKKVGGVIIISAGFAEIGEKGKQEQDEIVKILAAEKIPLVGPNCLGIIRPPVILNASFAPGMPKKGPVAFISQSGALIDSVIDQALAEDYGFSALVSYGNGAGLKIYDFLKYFQQDKETKAIAIYLEGIEDGKKFINIAKEVAKQKPIIVLKGGKTSLGKKAASLHTASLAGNAQIYSAAFRKAGLIEVETLKELFGVSLGLAWQKPCENNIGIITNGGAAGVLTTDWCERQGVKLAKLSKETIKTLNNSPLISKASNLNNPFDLIGDALSSRYEFAIETMLRQKDIYGIIVIQTMQIMTDSKENAKIIIKQAKKHPDKPIIACFMGGELTGPGAKLLQDNGIPNYTDPYYAVLAMKALISRQQMLKLLGK